MIRLYKRIKRYYNMFDASDVGFPVKRRAMGRYLLGSTTKDGPLRSQSLWATVLP